MKQQKEDCEFFVSEDWQHPLPPQSVTCIPSEDIRFIVKWKKSVCVF